MRFMLLILCLSLDGAANAAPKGASTSQPDTADLKRSAYRDKVLKEAHESHRAQDKSLREEERASTASIGNDPKRSDAEKKAAIEETSKKFSAKRWEMRRRTNAEIRLRLLKNPQ